MVGLASNVRTCSFSSYKVIFMLSKLKSNPADQWWPFKSIKMRRFHGTAHRYQLLVRQQYTPSFQIMAERQQS
jgi:hypothetical protein